MSKWISGTVGVILCGVPSLAFGQTRLQGLGATPAGDLRDDAAFAMSADGGTIVATVGPRAFRWRETEGWRELPPIPVNGERSATVSGVSATGRFAVGTSRSATIPGAAEAVIWDELGPALALGDLPGGSFNSFGHSVSADGNVVVGASNATDTDGPVIFRWVRGQTMANLGGQAQANPTLYDVNRVICTASGETVFGHIMGPQRARRWNGTWAFLGDLPGGGLTSWVRGISMSGDFAVGEVASSEGQVAYLWSPAMGMQWLGLSPIGTTNGTIAHAVSDDGRVVVGLGATGWLSQATIWQPEHGWRNLKLVLLSEFGITDADGWTMDRAVAISADGKTIAGRGVNPCGRQDIWLVRRIPQVGNCAADTNVDGFLDFFDYDEFVRAFEIGIPAADFNRDCFVDFFDYDGFVEAFEMGC